MITVQVSPNQKTISNKTNYNTIDLLKFIFAFFVFTIHFPPFPREFLGIGNYLNFILQNGICRLAVPFYFASSSFFLFKKMSLSDINFDLVKSYSFRLLRMLGTWYFLSFFGEIDHLWYLGALVLGVIVLSVLFRLQISTRKIIIISCVFYFVGLLGNSYYGLLENISNINVIGALISVYDQIFTTTRNGLFMGVFYILIGALFAHKKINIPFVISIIGFIISVIFMYAEGILLYLISSPKGYDMFIFQAPAVLFLMSIAINLKLPDKNFYKKIRTVGTLIFYSHLMIIAFTRLFVNTLRSLSGLDLSPYIYVIAIINVTVIAFIIEWLSHKQKFHWLKYLYS